MEEAEATAVYGGKEPGPVTAGASCISKSDMRLSLIF